MGGRNGRRRVIRDVYKGHMDKAKGGVGLRVAGEDGLGENGDNST